MSNKPKLKQPRALYSLALTEMWERFGLYIVQGLLIFYMTKALQFSDSHAYQTLGEFTALVYISPILGGLFADRLLGFRQSILTGAVLLLLGYGQIALGQETLLFTGLATVILGNGFLKPNISSFLGCFYHDNDPRRDAGFTLFYMVFNVGVFMATASSGFIQEHFGWNITFATAALGMVVAMAFFIHGYRYYGEQGRPLRHITANKQLMRTWGTTLSSIILLATACYWLLRFAHIGHQLMFIIGGLVAISLIYLTARLEHKARNKMIALILFITISIIFWALFFQLFFVINLFIDRSVDRQVFGITLPPVLFISLEALFVFLLSPLFAMLWRRLHQKGIPLPTGSQFSLSLLAIAAGMGILCLALHLTGSTQLMNPLWIIAAYFLITCGELLLSPIGLSVITRLAPKKIVGLMMGIWFMSLGFGGSLAGVLAKQASVPKALINNLEKTHSIYQQAFQHYALIALIAGLIILILTPWLKRLES